MPKSPQWNIRRKDSFNDKARVTAELQGQPNFSKWIRGLVTREILKTMQEKPTEFRKALESGSSQEQSPQSE